MMPIPHFPAQWQPLVDQAAATLRALALDESAKEKFCNDPLLRPYMHKVSQRYVAGRTVAEALQRVEHIIAQGHAASAEYMGESVRDESFAMAETNVFMELTKAIGQPTTAPMTSTPSTRGCTRRTACTTSASRCRPSATAPRRTCRR